jgi:hypothetical protein
VATENSFLHDLCNRRKRYISFNLTPQAASWRQCRNMKKVLNPFHFVLIAVAGWMNYRQYQLIDYLREENRVPRDSRNRRFSKDYEYTWCRRQRPWSHRSHPHHVQPTRSGVILIKHPLTNQNVGTFWHRSTEFWCKQAHTQKLP